MPYKLMYKFCCRFVYILLPLEHKMLFSGGKFMKYTVGLLIAVCLVAACGKEKPAPQANIPAVNVVRVLKQDLPWTMEYPAQVMGSLDVQVRAQVGGILQARLYNEGEYVEAGTQLFQIDEQPYLVALEKANGTLAQALAQEKSAQRSYARMQKLRAANAVSKQDYDNALSAYETARANVQVAQAGVHDAQINLGYTRVVAPISGIAGKEAQSVGSLISPDGDLLTSMVKIHPLHVTFSMPGSQFRQLAAGFSSGQISLGDNMKGTKDATSQDRPADASEAVYLEAILPNGTLYPQRGKIIFFDSSEDAQTSSLEMKAEFANPDHRRQLMPGQFIRVRLVGAVYKEAVLIPTSAVLNTAHGLTVYVIGDDNTAQTRLVEAQAQGDVYLVSKGLNGGELIINGGLIKVRPGEKVQPNVQAFQVPASSENIPQSANQNNLADLQQALQAAEVSDEESLPGAASSNAANELVKGE